METVEYANAIAYLSERIDGLVVKQDTYHEKTWEKLEQWSETNAELVRSLREQSQDNRASTGTYQSLVQHLLTFAQTTQQLTSTTWKLDSSSEKLMHYLMEEQAAQFKSLEANNEQLQESSSLLARYLIEEQSPQLENLKANSQQLKTSSSNLETYLKEEQSQRLKLLETSIRTLLEMIEASQETSPSPIATSSVKSTATPVQDSLPVEANTKAKSHPPSSSATAIAHSTEENQSYRLYTVILSVSASFITTVFLLIAAWSVGGIGDALANISRMSELSPDKLENPESALGVEEQKSDEL